MKNKNTLIVFIAIIGSFLLLIGYGFLIGKFIFPDGTSSQVPYDAVRLAKLKVNIGDSRTTMLDNLSDAWFHAECQSGNADLMEDLFLYGPQHPDKVQLVIIGSEKKQGIIRVTSIGGFEGYMLHLHDHCIPDPSQVFLKP